jgi:hypothetical protein
MKVIYFDGSQTSYPANSTLDSVICSTVVIDYESHKLSHEIDLPPATPGAGVTVTTVKRVPKLGLSSRL